MAEWGLLALPDLSLLAGLPESYLRLRLSHAPPQALQIKEVHVQGLAMFLNWAVQYNTDSQKLCCWHCRAGVTPFLAAHLHGYDNFKWMLYGDDDTVFFIDNALDMLEGLDHNMPYFLTDHLWFPDQFGEDPISCFHTVLCWQGCMSHMHT